MIASDNAASSIGAQGECCRTQEQPLKGYRNSGSSDDKHISGLIKLQPLTDVSVEVSHFKSRST